MKQEGCQKVQLLNDKEVYGAGLGRNIQSSAEGQGLEIISNEAIDKNAANYRSLAAKAKAAGADCMVFSGMRLALDAIERSGTGKKPDVLEALFESKDRHSVLGTYSIDENGDTSLTDYGVYTIDSGELRFDQTIKAETG